LLTEAKPLQLRAARASDPASYTALEYSNVTGCERLFPTATNR
jgi:hypothetical protein